MLATLDNPATGAELDQFWGTEAENTSAADDALRAIRAIKPLDMTPAVAAHIIRALACAIARTNHAHTDDTVAAIEYLDDANAMLEAV